MVLLFLILFLRLPDEALLDELTLTDEEISAITPPAARLLARSGIQEHIRKKILHSGDAVALVGALGLYGYRCYSSISAYVRRHPTGKEQPHATVGHIHTQPGAQFSVPGAAGLNNGHSAEGVLNFFAGLPRAEG